MSLPFDPQAGLIVVPVRLWGPDGDTIARLALDTGATGSLVNWDIAVLLGYDPVWARPAATSKYTASPPIRAACARATSSSPYPASTWTAIVSSPRQ